MLYFFCTNKTSEIVVPFRFYNVQESMSENYVVCSKSKESLRYPYQQTWDSSTKMATKEMP